ncbi:MAG: hypothetical protein IJG47_06105 [Microbacterium sp.]|nr:hypothetical protein [Microbacterium sp.]
MKTWISAGAGMLLLVTLVGCSTAAPEPDPRLEQWLDSWSSDAAASNADSLGAGAGIVSPSDDEAGGVTMSYLDGDSVATIEFSCSGPASMSFVYEIDAGAESLERRVDDLACDDGSHSIDVDVDGVTQVRVNAVTTTVDGAWGAALRGGN